MYITEGTFNLKGGNIVGNSAGEDCMGGGVCVEGSNAEFNMSGTARILGNMGGGVYNGGSFNMAGGTIGYNTAGNGGGVYNVGTFTMNGGYVIGNDVEGADGEPGQGGGVGVFAGGTFIMSGGEISGNKSNGDGGGVYVNAKFDYQTIHTPGGTFKMDDGIVTTNTATGNGDGVYAGSQANITLIGTAKIVGNDTDNLYLCDDTKVDIDEDDEKPKDDFSVGVTTQTPPTDGVPVKITTNDDSTDSTDTNYFSSDNADYEIKFNTDHLELAVIPPHTHNMGTDDPLDDITFTTEIKTLADLQSLFTNGGSGYLANDIVFTETLHIKKDVSLCLNDKVIDLDGKWVIYVEDNAKFNLYDCGEGTTRYYDKNATTGLWTLNTALTSGDYDTTGGVITHGCGSNAGAVYVEKGSFTMNGGNLAGNQTTAYGGGLNVNADGTATINGGTICGNTAVYGGGVSNKGTLTMTGGTIIGNTASYSGGGVNVESGSFTMNGGNLAGNKTTAYGGGLNINTDGTATINGGTISGNTAKCGGGISDSGMLTMNGGTVCDNTAADSYGYAGGVYVFGGSFTMNDGIIKNNTATVFCGGVYIKTKSSFTMNGGTISGNTAPYSGGVYVSHGEGTVGTFTMTGGTISDNTAEYGGGIMNNGCMKLTAATDKTITITGNTATTECGGIANWDSGNDNFAMHLSGKVIIKDNICNAKDDAGVNYPVNLATDKLIFIDGTLTGSEIYITHANIDEGEHDTGVLTSGFITKNPGAKLGDFFTYDGPDSYDMVLNADGANAGELEVATAYAITNNAPSGSENDNHGYLTIDKPSAAEGNTVTVTVTPSSGYQLKAGSLKIELPENCPVCSEALTSMICDKCGAEIPELVLSQNNIYTFTMPAYAVTVTAEFEKIPTPSSGSSSPTVTVPVSGDGNKVNVSASVSGNTATVKAITDAELDKVTGGEAVEINLTGLKKDIDTAKIPTATVEKIGDKGGMSVKLTTATVTFDKAATQEIAAQADGKTIELVVDDIKEVSLNAVQKEAVGKLDTALIIDAYLVSNGTRLCSESKGGFGGGKATVALPFEIKNNRTSANYSVYYVDDAGNLEKLNAKYDSKLGAFLFDITHFSNYVVAYDENACPQDETCVYAKFTDADTTAWYHDGVHFCVEKGYMKGVSATAFDPRGTTTRAMIVTMLWRMEGKPVVNYAMSFKDVPADKWFTEAIRWAQSTKIVKGYSTEKFGPKDPITREQMATILYRYAKYHSIDVENTNTLAGYTDANKVSTWALDAMKWANAAGLVQGRTTTTLVPKVSITRAEAATMVQRYCEAFKK